MRMTIDTAITVLGMVEAHGVCIEAKDVAVDTMRKYQQIEKIVNNTFQNIAKEDERYAYEWLGDIKEILENGRND